jgi:hypothetical protein
MLNLIKSKRFALSRALHGNIHITNVARNSNNGSNPTPVFIGLHQTTQKHGRHVKKKAEVKMEGEILKQKCFNG